MINFLLFCGCCTVVLFAVVLHQNIMEAKEQNRNLNTPPDDHIMFHNRRVSIEEMLEEIAHEMS
jgi:hypothetical protein